MGTAAASVSERVDSRGAPSASTRSLTLAAAVPAACLQCCVVQFRITMEDKYANPWQTLSSRRVYDNPWISVREDQVVRPDGQPGIYGVVHMKNKAIGVVPIDAAGNIYLIGQYRY